MGTPDDHEAANIPDLPEPDRLMSSVMSMAQDAVARVEELRVVIAALVKPWDDLTDKGLKDDYLVKIRFDPAGYMDEIRAGRAALAKAAGQ